MIVDAVGKLVPSDGNKSLKNTGRYFSITKESSPETVEDLHLLKALIEAGEIRLVIDRCYPLDQIVEAHRYVENGHKKGNVVVAIL